MDKKRRNLWTTLLVITFLGVVLSFVGSIMMFLDKGYYKNYPHPVSGIMPFFGFLFALVALILLIVAYKKNKVAIGTIVLSFISALLLWCSRFTYNGYGIPWYGYFYFCVLPGMFLFVVAISTIAFVVSKSKNGDSVNALGMSKPELLKDYKELLDMGVITQQEYDEKKRQIIG